MFRQEPVSRNMSTNNNTMLFSSTTNFKNDNVGEGQLLMKGKDTMMMSSSDVFQQQQNPSGLTRYRSAPSTFFTTYLDGLHVTNTNSDSSQDGDHEAENMFSAFMGCSNGSSTNLGMQNLNDLQQYSSNLKQEMGEYDQQQNGLVTVENCQMAYETSTNGAYGGRIDEHQLQSAKISSGNSSNNLLRQSSSPAGFFAGYDISREIENFRSIGGSNSTSNGVNNQLNFTSFESTAPCFMPSIPEIRNESSGTGSSKDGQLRNGTNPNGRSYIPNSWIESSSTSLKRNLGGDLKFSSFSELENEKGDSRNVSHGLTHHLSLPKTSSEMAVIEKFLEFQQDNVIPCKIRAKRGFATHPRSIAERVRRTRISQRMKKLQELFPNMDKQANTADMLDLAVEHIKELQKQVHVRENSHLHLIN
ncbi:hypothetical protein Leryth_024740 [Lithospermum erythrorhizon]|nr:hypothetical protein Leryth_024740 [Lithospermum erythrorhizon]